MTSAGQGNTKGGRGHSLIRRIRPPRGRASTTRSAPQCSVKALCGRPTLNAEARRRRDGSVPALADFPLLTVERLYLVATRRICGPSAPRDQKLNAKSPQRVDIRDGPHAPIQDVRPRFCRAWKRTFRLHLGRGKPGVQRDAVNAGFQPVPNRSQDGDGDRLNFPAPPQRASIDRECLLLRGRLIRNILFKYMHYQVR